MICMSQLCQCTNAVVQTNSAFGPFLPFEGDGLALRQAPKVDIPPPSQLKQNSRSRIGIRDPKQTLRLAFGYFLPQTTHTSDTLLLHAVAPDQSGDKKEDGP